jgi:hypothetical protein
MAATEWDSPHPALRSRSFDPNSGVVQLNSHRWQDHVSFGYSTSAGFYLANKLWMLNSPSDFVYDKSSGVLYVWLPDSSAPAADSVVYSEEHHNGIELEGANTLPSRRS